MSKHQGILLDAAKPRHADGVRRDKAWEADADARKALERLGVSKRMTTVNATTATKASSDGDAPAVGSPMTPNAEQMAKIAPFLKSPKSPEELVVFQTLSANTLVDRDDDRFTEQCIADLLALEAPLSFVGKSFMLDHNYSVGNAVGRIYDEGTEKGELDGQAFDWLTHEVYVPNTEQFAPLIEKIDFGIAWAVSVGLMLGKQTCSICDSGFYSWGYSCYEGHDKGYYYLEDAEEDSWGYPIPCDSRTAGAKKCIREFSEPKDGYELSQVFLGAQYLAGQKGAGAEMVSASKTVTFQGHEVPILQLAAEEAEKLPMSHEPKEVTTARQTFGVEVDDDDGSVRWKDAEGLLWIYNASDSAEVRLLGSASDVSDDGDDPNTKENSHDGERTPVPGGSGGSEGVREGHQPGRKHVEEGAGRSVGEGAEGGDPDLEGSPSSVSAGVKTVGSLRSLSTRIKSALAKAGSDDVELSDEAAAVAASLEVLDEEIDAVLAAADEDDDTDDDAELDSDDADLVEAAEEATDALEDEIDEDDPDDDEDEPDEKSAKVKGIASLALRSGVPASIVGAWKSGDDPSIEDLLALVGKHIKEAGPSGSPELRAKAVIADNYIKELRTQALASFALANRNPKDDGKGVDTKNFQKTLDLIGDDAEALKGLISDNQTLAKQRFPSPTRRSSVPVEPGETDLPEQSSTDSDEKVSRLHTR